MKRIKTNHISDTAGLPILARTIDFLSESIMETSASSVYSQLNSSDDSVPIVLWGCDLTYSTTTTTNDTLTHTSGAILYNGEIYSIPSGVITKTGADVFLLKNATATYQSGEPTTYTDLTTYNTNEVRRLNFYTGAAGTGICEEVSLLWLNKYYHSDSTSGGDGIIDYITVSNATVNSIHFTANKKGNLIHFNCELTYTTTSSSPHNVVIHLYPKFFKKSPNVEYFPLIGYAGSTAINGDVYTSTANSGVFVIAKTITTGTTLTVVFNATYEAYSIG